MTLTLETPGRFSLEKTVLLHGWVWLPPYRWNEAQRALGRWEALPSGRVVHLDIRQPRAGRVVVRVEGDPPPLSVAEREAVVQHVRRALSLDVDLTEFSALAKRQAPKVWRFLQDGGGRLLRGCSLYEDLVKTLFTTNAAWAYTERMTETFCCLFGRRAPSKEQPGWAFPDPVSVQRALAHQGRAPSGFGYRLAYLAALTTRVANDQIAPTLEHPHIVATRKAEILGALPGFGPYAVNHMLVLLHHFDQLPVDREVLAYLGVAGKPAAVQQQRIEAYRQRWGRWAFLGYKLEREVTQKNWNGR
jgi:3-methyladenine DNA glycosylase/8-oxoguanine DNA glycosylase